MYLTRPIATHVLSHCYFWSIKEQLKFLQDVSDLLPVKNTKVADSSIYEHVETDAEHVIGNDWKERIDKSLAQSM